MGVLEELLGLCGAGEAVVCADAMELAMPRPMIPTTTFAEML